MTLTAKQELIYRAFLEELPEQNYLLQWAPMAEELDKLYKRPREFSTGYVSTTFKWRLWSLLDVRVEFEEHGQKSDLGKYDIILKSPEADQRPLFWATWGNGGKTWTLRWNSKNGKNQFKSVDSSDWKTIMAAMLEAVEK